MMPQVPPIRILCLKCNYIFSSELTSTSSKRSCPFCLMTGNISTDQTSDTYDAVLKIEEENQDGQ